MWTTEEHARPADVVCPMCLTTYQWVWEGDEWELESEWWTTVHYDFICGWHCYKRGIGADPTWLSLTSDRLLLMKAYVRYMQRKGPGVNADSESGSRDHSA